VQLSVVAGLGKSKTPVRNPMCYYALCRGHEDHLDGVPMSKLVDIIISVNCSLLI